MEDNFDGTINIGALLNYSGPVINLDEEAKKEKPDVLMQRIALVYTYDHKYTISTQLKPIDDSIIWVTKRS